MSLKSVIDNIILCEAVCQIRTSKYSQLFLSPRISNLRSPTIHERISSGLVTIEAISCFVSSLAPFHFPHKLAHPTLIGIAITTLETIASL